MFCKNCGKLTIGDATICDACLKAQEANQAPQSESDVNKYDAQPSYAQPYAYQSEAPVNNKMLGFKGALASTIVGSVGIELVAIFLSIAVYSPIVSLVLSFLFGVPCTIISLVLGIKSILIFKRAEGSKPIATLILGIAGVVCAATMIILAFFVIMLVAIALAYL